MTIKTAALAAIGALVLTTGAALANGGKTVGSLKDPGPVAAPCCDANWNGFYFGGGLGWGTMIASQTDDWGPSAASTPNHNEHEFGSDGIFGFLRIGLDRQVHPGIVLGAFADFEFHDTGFGSFGRRERRTKDFVVGTDRFSRDVDVDTAWAIGARIGVISNCCTMWYFNAGYTEAELDFKFTRNNVTVPGTVAGETYGGWFIGGGLEQQLARGWGLSFEYRLAALDNKTIFSGFYDMGGATNYHLEKLEPTLHTVRMGVTYKFDIDRGRMLEPMK